MSRRDACPSGSRSSARELVPLLWSEDLGCGGALDAELLARSEEAKRALYAGQAYIVVPIYVTSICAEQCLYCNYRAGNSGIAIQRKRLSDAELAREAAFVVEQFGLRALELVYASDPGVTTDAMCRHVEVVSEVLERHGGGIVGLNAESLEESDYRRLVDAGVSFSVVWQETYDASRYAMLHPGKRKKTSIEYRLDCYERMLSAGMRHIGMGVLSGLADWRHDWAMLLLHEEYLQQRYGRGAAILGIPRLKHAPGAVLHESDFIPSDREFMAAVALHNIFSPETRAFISTREEWNLCLELARGGGCLFTLNCATTPGGYSKPTAARQFKANSYSAPIYLPKLREAGLKPVLDWRLDAPDPLAAPVPATTGRECTGSISRTPE